MRYQIMDIEQRKKTGAVLRQNAQSTAPVQRSAASLLQAGLLAVQAGLGNRYIQRVVDSARQGSAALPIQAKLLVGLAQDEYEREADRVAAQLISMPETTPKVQRMGQDEQEKIQTKLLAAAITPLVHRAAELDDAFEPSADFESRLASTHGGGSSLPAPTREFMEQRFGADFSGVRVHTDGESARLNREINAQAFTRGQEIYLGGGQVNIESSAGRQLLAHELVHVMQQIGSGINTLPGEKTQLSPIQNNLNERIQRNGRQLAARSVSSNYIPPYVTFQRVRDVWEHGGGRNRVAQLCPGYDPGWTLLQKVEAINKELASGNLAVIAESLGIGVDHPDFQSHKKNIMDQLFGMSISGSTDVKAAKIFSDYTKSEYENVTAYIRGTKWNKETKRLEPATQKIKDQGKYFLEQLDEQWDKGPIAEGFPVVWRVESGPPDTAEGEISGAHKEKDELVFSIGKKYTKGNTASTSAVQPIADRVNQPGKVLLRITNTKDGDRNYRQPVDLRRLSFYLEEGEILYPAYTTYKVTGTTIMKFGVRKIPVVEVAAEPPKKMPEEGQLESREPEHEFWAEREDEI